MQRRTFAQWLTLLGAIGVSQTAEAGGDPQTKRQGARGKAAASGEQADADSAADSSAEPVNVHDFKKAAKAKLPRATFEYISTGSADQNTLRANTAAFRRIQILPPLLRGVKAPNLSTTVLKQRIELPVMLAPVAAQRMYHPQGALAAARAAAKAGTLFGVSSSAGNSVEEIAQAAPGPKWFQLYPPKDREVARQLVVRAEKAGYQAIIVTVDLGEWKDADRRNRFTLPKEMLYKHLRDIGFSQVQSKMSYQQLLDFNLQAWEPALSWKFFDWLRSITRLPILIKGVLREDDAGRAVDAGLDGIVVSNHGGRRLDGMPPTIDVLPAIAAKVGNRAEVFLDGGVRRGTDVIKAVALGARAVLVGRPYAWALAANGQAGVESMLQIMRDELNNAMTAVGCQNLADVDASLLSKLPAPA